MSVISMTNLAYARRKDVSRDDKGLNTTKKVAEETGQKPSTATSATSAIAAMTAYIPTEVLTVYVAVLGAVGVTVPAGTAGTAPGASPVASIAPSASAVPSEPVFTAATAAASTPFPVYAIFIVLVPIVVWGLYARTVKAADKPLPKSFGAWPKWEMVAGTVAFAVWAGALPSSPLEQFSWFSAAVAGVVALIVSMLIGVFAPLFASATLKNS